MSYCKIKTTNFNNLNSLLKGHTMERKILVTALLAGTTLLVACDDIAKGVAREILKDEVAPAQTVQEPQVQDLQPIIPNGQQPVQQYNQYGQPIANQQQMPMQPQVQDLQPVIPIVSSLCNNIISTGNQPPTSNRCLKFKIQLRWHKLHPCHHLNQPQKSENELSVSVPMYLHNMVAMSWFVVSQISMHAKSAICMTVKMLGSLVKQPTAKPLIICMAAG